MPYLNLVLQSHVAIMRESRTKGTLPRPSRTSLARESQPIRSVCSSSFRWDAARRETTGRFMDGVESNCAISPVNSRRRLIEVLTEVEIAAGEVETTFQELRGKYDAMMAAEEESVDYLNERWLTLPGEDRAASFVLEELLDAQERSMLEQYGFAQAQVAHTLSLVQLRRSTGTLLQHEGVIFQRFCDGCIPRLALQKDMLSAPSPGVDTTVESGD